MSLNAAAVRLLAEKGLSAFDIAEVMEAIEAKPRAMTGAERVRKHRENKVAERNESNVTNVTDTPSPSPSSPPYPPNNPTPAPTPGNKPRARKGTRLDEDWKPEPVIGKTAEMLENWPPGAVERELEKFRNYWLAKAGKDACKTSWQRTWINWLISADERIAKHGSNSRNSGSQRAPELDGFGAALRRMSGFGDAPPGSHNRRGSAEAEGMG